MKIYQIHKTGFCDGDWYDIVIDSYLDKEKAEKRMNEIIEDKKEEYEDCPIGNCNKKIAKYTILNCNGNCDTCILFNDFIEHIGIDEINLCKYGFYEDCSYEIEELEVIE